MDRKNTLELANYGRTLSGKSEFKDYDEYKDYIAEDEFILDAEIDQSLKIIVDIINQEVWITFRTESISKSLPVSR